MRTTVILDDEVIKEAKRITGISRTTDLINKGIQELVRKENIKSLIALGGTMPDLQEVPRRRF